MLLRRKPRSDEEIFVKIFKKQHMPFEKTISHGIVKYKITSKEADINMIFVDGEWKKTDARIRA
jgi:hypothetical protein